MKLLKKLALMACVLAAFSGVNVAMAADNALSGGVAVVDVDRVLVEYKKAQDVSSDMKIQEAEFQKALADAQKQVKDTTSPVERRNLEEKLTKQLQVKAEDVRKQQIKKLQEIEDSISGAIKVTTDKKYVIVLKKAAVISGGTDITNDILKILNQPELEKKVK